MPSGQEKHLLQSDLERLAEMIAAGDVEG